ncbi:MAG: AlpA family transcriptional regulator [Bdellovibrionaceae bacterium]|nr:AlpA family transcriptional regulator [Pseudobdellovibrionaceae bacterium]|tara:strand:+ start:173656 stop:173862 length:207 start_codon:yes stop_codon:yes gene_type:complete
MNRILRLPVVAEITGLPQSSIYEKIKEGNFPKPIKLGARSVGWSEKAIADWINERIEQSELEQGGDDV